MKENKIKTLSVILISLIIACLIIICSILFFREDNEDISSGLLNSNEIKNEEAEYKVNINPDDCLNKAQIAELLDLGSFEDNEMMVYRNDDNEHPIEVWRIKIESGEDQKEIIRLMQQRRESILESFSGDLDMQEKLSRQEQNVLNCGGRNNDVDCFNSCTRS